MKPSVESGRSAVIELSLGKDPQFRNLWNLGSLSRMRLLYGLVLEQQKKIEDILTE